MSRQAARDALASLHMRPALLAAHYAQVPAAGPEVPSLGLLADLRELAATPALTDEARQRQEAVRRADLLAAYGFENVNQEAKPFAFADGLAIIPIHGLLINRFSYSFGFLTGYNFIRSQVAAAIADPDVTGIVYDVNSPGGTVAGCQETSDTMFAASAAQGGKPSLAVVDANCYSAAYMLASAADNILSTPTGGAGSIGVLLMHVDLSRALDKSGVKVTLLHSGAHKVDGNPYEPLSEEVASDLQSEIDKMYDRFVSTVARNRPGLTAEAIRGTEARCYQADDAVAQGLIDGVAPPNEALSAFFDDGEDADDAEMRREGASKVTTKPTQNTPDNQTQAEAPDPAAAATAARQAERDRVRGIQTHAEAEGRTKLAEHLALETDLTVEAAAGILKASPKASAAPAPQADANHFQAAMDNGTQPNVGAGAEGPSGSSEAKPSRADEILEAQRRMMGTKPARAA